MYELQMDHVTYRHKTGRPFTLVEAMREVYGTGNCRVLRLDGTVAVDNAGSSVEVTHAPTGRRITRRLSSTGRRRWFADYADRAAARSAA